MKKIILILLSMSSFCFGKESCLSEKIECFSQNYQKELPADENFVFSPYSLYNCLGCALLGAKEKTLASLGAALFVEEPLEQFSRDLFALKQRVSSSHLQVVDAIWVCDDIVLKPSYEELLPSEKKIFSGKDPAAISSRINRWVFDATRGEIKELFSPDEITRDTKCILTNALYFEDSFVFPFPLENTKSKPFYGAKKQTVSMMAQTINILYYEDESLQYIILPMKSSRFGAFFVLPKKPLQNLPPVTELYAKASPHFVYIELPSFKMEKTSSPKTILKQMGVKEPFTDEANFTGITEETFLKIDAIVHKATFDLTENGIKAAAASGARLGLTSITLPQDSDVSFIANKPFFFGIVDVKLGLVLFLGHLVDPAG